MALPPEGTAMVAIDYDPADLQIHECSFCRWWWAELVLDDACGQVLREWHLPDCPIAVAWSIPAADIQMPAPRSGSRGESPGTDVLPG
ncbi:MAG: hypothetical protein ACR2K2_16095 [Mycobacteriales bacterium]